MGLSCWLRLFRPLVSRGCGYSAECCCGGFAAGALLSWLCRLGLTRRLAVVLRRRVYQAAPCCGGFAAGALLGWPCTMLMRVWRLGVCFTLLLMPAQLGYRVQTAQAAL